MNAPLFIAPSVCPHDCTSACARDVEVLDARTIGRVCGSERNAYTVGVAAAGSSMCAMARPLGYGGMRCRGV